MALGFWARPNITVILSADSALERVEETYEEYTKAFDESKLSIKASEQPARWKLRRLSHDAVVALESHEMGSWEQQYFAFRHALMSVSGFWTIKSEAGEREPLILSESDIEEGPYGQRIKLKWLRDANLPSLVIRGVGQWGIALIQGQIPF